MIELCLASGEEWWLAAVVSIREGRQPFKIGFL